MNEDEDILNDINNELENDDFGSDNDEVIENNDFEEEPKRKPKKEAENVDQDQDLDDSDEDEDPDVEEEIEDDEEEEAPIDEEDSKLIKIDLDGEEKELTLGEIKQGYMRQSDYTKKTQEAADIRKAHFDSTSDFIKWSRDILEQFDESILVTEEQKLRSVLSSIDVRELTSEELSVYTQQKAYLEQLENQNFQRKQAMEELSKKAQEEREKANSAFRQTEMKKLEEVLPDFKSENKKKKIQTDISNYLIEQYGREDAQKIVERTVHHKDMMTLYYASLGRQYLKNKDVKKSVIKPKPSLRNDNKQKAETSVDSIRRKYERTGRISAKEKDLLLDDELKEFY